MKNLQKLDSKLISENILSNLKLFIRLITTKLKQNSQNEKLQLNLQMKMKLPFKKEKFRKCLITIKISRIFKNSSLHWFGIETMFGDNQGKSFLLVRGLEL
ncbi:hypothetical protein BpHYR1_039118 [Brachionus plicatilis]|uniref:Uncharacterized protein n=1 Tax=Brachionus plicatilis TaxID=10195 RepID=A0A3M7RZV0_BRAPC|nr:hypothetical protein BpHYR1_039118 [Brachionus plicatilis]